MSNRIQSAIDIYQGKLDDMDASKVREFESTMDLAFDEHFAFQNAQSQAFAGGHLTLDEAQILYIGLGEIHSQSNGGWPANTSLATKAVITMACAELMGI